MNDLIKRDDAIECLEKVKECLVLDDQMFVDCLIDDIKRIEPFNQGINWIPCSERLPNSNGCYLVWRPHFWGGEIGMPAICYFDGQNTWHDSYGVDFERTLQPNDVTAWMPLPDPYKGE